MKKNLIYASIVSLFVIACKKEPSTIIVREERGYKCENNTCILVESGAQYLTLTDCKSECADSRPGSVQIEVTCPTYGYQQQVEIGIAYSSADISQNLFIDSKQWTGIQGASERVVLKFTKDGLSPGRYYYEVERNAPQIFPDKRGSVFEIKPNKTTSISVVY